MEKYVMVIDEGTTGTRALLYDKDFHIAGQSYEEFTQYTPSEDRVEHDGAEAAAEAKEAAEAIAEEEAAKEASAAPATDAPKAEETSGDVKTEETASESDTPAAE